MKAPDKLISPLPALGLAQVLLQPDLVHELRTAHLPSSLSSELPVMISCRMASHYEATAAHAAFKKNGAEAIWRVMELQS